MEENEIVLRITVQSKKSISLEKIIGSGIADKDEIVDAINNNNKQKLTEIINNIRSNRDPNTFHGEIQSISVEMENPEVSINMNDNVLTSNSDEHM